VNSDAGGTGLAGTGNNVSTLTVVAGGSGGAFTGTSCGGYGYANNTTGTGYGLFGQVNNASGFGSYGYNNNSGGTGIYGVGNGASGNYLTAGSGGAFTGTFAGAYGKATSSTGNGVIGVGNNYSTPSTLTGGSGGAFTGADVGDYGYAAGNASLRTGGYFAANGGAYVYVGLYAGGTLYKINGSGSVSTIMATREGKKNLFAPEMPESWFEDVGHAQLVNGHCRVNLEPLFSDCITVDVQHPLEVFVQLRGDCKGVYVTSDRTGFDVHELQNGTSNAEFSWRVLGKWKGNENLRLPDAPPPQPVQTVETRTASAPATVTRPTLSTESAQPVAPRTPEK
jgi:hypothetical protein